MNRCCSHKPIWIFLLSVYFIPYSYSQKIAQHVRISSGAVNGAFVENNGKTLVMYGDPKEEINKPEMVLFTDFRRDVVWAGRDLVKKGALAIAPAAQKAYFTRGDSIWSQFALTQFHERSNHTT